LPSRTPVLPFHTHRSSRGDGSNPWLDSCSICTMHGDRRDGGFIGDGPAGTSIAVHGVSLTLSGDKRMRTISMCMLGFDWIGDAMTTLGTIQKLKLCANRTKSWLGSFA
jgi:hypothetical protein